MMIARRAALVAGMMGLGIALSACAVPDGTVYGSTYPINGYQYSYYNPYPAYGWPGYGWGGSDLGIGFFGGGPGFHHGFRPGRGFHHGGLHAAQFGGGHMGGGHFGGHMGGGHFGGGHGGGGHGGGGGHH